MRPSAGVGALLKACVGLAIAAAMFAAMELGLRAAYGDPPRQPFPGNFKYAHIDVLKPFFKRTWSVFGRATVSSQRPLAQARPFSAPKPGGTLRIFVVGGSVADPFSNAIPKLVEFAENALPGKTVEVIGCGMQGYDSRREADVVREVLEYEPDLVVLLSGNNEALAKDAPVSRPRFLLWDNRLSAFWSYQKLRAFLRSRGLMPMKPPRAAGAVPEPIDGRFERNLRAMARMCRERGIPLVLNTLGVNLRDAPPSAPQRRDEPLYFDAMRAWERRDYRSAAERFRRFLDRFPEDASGRYYLAKAQDKLGAYLEAGRNYAAAADSDPSVNRTTPARNEIIRRVAREEGAILSDLEKAFATLSPQGIPGSDVFIDSCHWMHEYYPFSSLTILRAVYEFNRTRGASALAPASAWLWEWTEEQPTDERKPAISAESRAYYDGRALHSGLAGAVMMDDERLSEGSIELLRQVLRRDPEAFKRLTGSKESLGSLLSNPLFKDYGSRLDAAWPWLLVHFGEVWRREGRPDLALAAFSAAAEQRPGNYRARLGRAVTTAAAGRAAQARSEFRYLIEYYPEHREPRLWAEYFERRGGERSR